MRPPDDCTLLDILNSALRVRRWLATMSRDEFMGDDKSMAAVVREITIVGEAVKRLSDTFKSAHSQISWRQIAGMRNILIHNYDHVDAGEVWKVAQTSLPQLAAFIQSLNIVPSETKT